MCIGRNNLGDNLISCLCENYKSYNLIALFYFLHSKLSKCKYLGRDNLVLCFSAYYKYVGTYSTFRVSLSGIRTSYTGSPPSATQTEPLLPFSIRWIIPLATLSGLQIKQCITHLLKCDWPIVWAEGQVLSWKQRCLIQLAICIFICWKQTKNVDSNITHCYRNFRWLLKSYLENRRNIQKKLCRNHLVQHNSLHTVLHTLSTHSTYPTLL